jgi:predicted glycosyltransferase
MEKNKKNKVWIDLDNSPHVPFFRPIIGALEKKGYRVCITIRENAQTSELAQLFKIPHKKIGKHYGKNKIIKVLGTIFRMAQLLPHILKERPAMALSHGSRSQILVAKALGIPSVGIGDYEHATGFFYADWVIIPEIIKASSFSIPTNRIFTYPGIKEDVYVPFFKPDPIILDELQIPKGNIFTTIRPPANEAHYHNPESEKLFEEVINYFAENANISMLILPRYDSQLHEIKSKYSELVKNRRMIIPENVYDGLNLIWFSDFVVSGGGTMNREAAALGVPVYSIFRGKIGAVDHYLSQSKRLVLLESVEDVRKKIRVEKRAIPDHPGKHDNKTLESIVGTITTLLDGKGK